MTPKLVETLEALLTAPNAHNNPLPLFLALDEAEDWDQDTQHYARYLANAVQQCYAGHLMVIYGTQLNSFDPDVQNQIDQLCFKDQLLADAARNARDPAAFMAFYERAICYHDELIKGLGPALTPKHIQSLRGTYLQHQNHITIEVTPTTTTVDVPVKFLIHAARQPALSSIVDNLRVLQPKLKSSTHPFYGHTALVLTPTIPDTHNHILLLVKSAFPGTEIRWKYPHFVGREDTDSQSQDNPTWQTTP